MASAILFVGHGSRDPDGTEEFQRLVEHFRRDEPARIVEAGFLEFAKPVIGAAIATCVERGAKNITVLPGMLMAAGHAKNDIPSEIHDARLLYPKVDFHYGRHLHLHAKIIELSRLRIEEAESRARPHDRRDTLLMVVARGSSDPDANADVLKLARILWEGMGFGWGAASYIGVTTPLLPEALERCRRLGFGRIIVFPFFLFTGILEKRIRAISHAFGHEHPGTDILYASYLNVHPLLLDVFRERAQEAIAGSPNMNCELCKYRVPLPGFAAAVGQPQHGHHHHVRGIGQDEHGHVHEHPRDHHHPHDGD
jgi:sirohydrochlorin cobaltochelatase